MDDAGSTLSVPTGGMPQAFQNVNIDDDQFLVFLGETLGDFHIRD